MIYDASNPYGELFHEDSHEDPIEDTIEEVPEELNERKGTSVSDILEDRQNIKKYSNLVAYGVIGVIGLLILKRYM